MRSETGEQAAGDVVCALHAKRELIGLMLAAARAPGSRHTRRFPASLADMLAREAGQHGFATDVQPHLLDDREVALSVTWHEGDG